MKLLTRDKDPECFEWYLQRAFRKEQALLERMFGWRSEKRHMNFEGVSQITATDTWTNDTTAKHLIGSRAMTRDGRVYHYSRIGAVAGVAGSLYQGSIPIAGNLNQTPAAAAIGATQVTISAITTTVTANQYAGGWLNVSVTPGFGQMYTIASHPAATGGAALIITLYPDDPIQVALTTSSRVGLIASQWADVIITPTTSTQALAGVPNVIMALATFGWLQTWGPCSVLTDATPAAAGVGVVNSAATIGAVGVSAAAATEINFRQCAISLQLGVSTERNPYALKIAA